MATDSSLSVAANLAAMADTGKRSSFGGACSLKRKRPPQIEIPNILQEIKTDRFGFRDSAVQNDAVCVAGDGYGVSSIKGKKKFMEDTHKIVSGSMNKTCKGYFGVYDGHGGVKAAEFVADNLHTNVLEVMEKCEGNAAKEEAVKAGYLKTDQQFLDLGVSSGACCVTAVIEGKNIIISNAGDCRAVLCRGGVAESLTKDHRVEQEDERKRIEDKGGYVEIHRGTWRVHGVLSVSRSIGDAHLKDWVVAEPDTKILNLTPDMEFLVLASDGLWDEGGYVEIHRGTWRVHGVLSVSRSIGDAHLKDWVVAEPDTKILNLTPDMEFLVLASDGLWDEVGNQEAVDTVMRLCHSDKKLGPAGDLWYDNGDNLGHVNVSPSSKIRRISLIKQQQKGTCKSPSYKRTVDIWKDSENEFPCEYESPPSKCRRISLVKRLNMKESSLPSQENSCYKKRNSSLVNACKELVNLAVSRGSLDDITVIVIDLDHFRSEAVPL